jgi:hypothetical protein
MEHTAVFGSIAEDSGVIGEGTRADWAPRADAQDRLKALVDVGVKRLVVPAGWVVRLSPFAAKAGLEIFGVHDMQELINLLSPQAPSNSVASDSSSLASLTTMRVACTKGVPH